LSEFEETTLSTSRGTTPAAKGWVGDWTSMRVSADKDAVLIKNDLKNEIGWTGYSLNSLPSVDRGALWSTTKSECNGGRVIQDTDGRTTLSFRASTP
jgi:hypothetical protein